DGAEDVLAVRQADDGEAHDLDLGRPPAEELGIEAHRALLVGGYEVVTDDPAGIGLGGGHASSPFARSIRCLTRRIRRRGEASIEVPTGASGRTSSAGRA